MLTAHLDEPNDETLIDAKWESLALAPCDDAANPNDYFLFTAVSTLNLVSHTRPPTLLYAVVGQRFPQYARRVQRAAFQCRAGC